MGQRTKLWAAWLGKKVGMDENGNPIEGNQTPQGEGDSQGNQGESTPQTTDGDKSVDWEAKYKEAVAQSRKWEKLAKADHKRVDDAQGNAADAVARAEAAEKELAEMKAEKARTLLVSEIATDKQVDAAVLSRMAGDDRETIEANADMLAALGKGNSYPKVKDKGESKAPTMSKSEILTIQNPRERRKAIAENIDLFE